MRSFFRDLVGNDSTKARLAGALSSNTLPHAFLIDGPSGSGKMTLALSLAKALNCHNKKSSDIPLPCGTCPACRRISSNNFPDVRILDKPSDKASTGVDDIKDFKSDVYLSPTEAECKVYILNSAHTLTPAAQNALLIFLEEPPPNVYVMLLACGVDKILTTIKSRAQYIAMEHFTSAALLGHLKSLGIIPNGASERDGALSELLVAADGRIGLARELLAPKSQKMILQERELTLSLIKAMRRGAAFSSLLAATRALPAKRAELAHALDSAISALRDLLTCKHSENAELLFYTSRELLREHAGAFSRQRLFLLYDALSAALNALDRNANIQTLLYTLAVRIRGIDK